MSTICLITRDFAHYLIHKIGINHTPNDHDMLDIGSEMNFPLRTDTNVTKTCDGDYVMRGPIDNVLDTLEIWSPIYQATTFTNVNPN